MILSQTCQIAIKAVAYISGYEKGCVRVKELAEITEENPHTIAKVLQSLVKSGMLSSITGPNGGFYLTEKQAKQSLLEVVKAVDGVNVFESCVLGLKQCSAKRPCPMHEKFSLLRKDLKTIFEKTSFDELISVDLKTEFFLR